MKTSLKLIRSRLFQKFSFHLCEGGGSMNPADEVAQASLRYQDRKINSWGFCENEDWNDGQWINLNMTIECQ